MRWFALVVCAGWTLASGAAFAQAADAKTSAPLDAADLEQERFRTHNTWLGPVGGMHVVDAGSGPAGTLRLQLGVDFFSTSDYLALGDENDWVGGTLSMSLTLTDFLEVFGGVANHANSNSADKPELLQVLGDTLLGVKAFDRTLDWLALGGDLRIVVLNSVGGIGPVFGGTSLGLRGNASADLRRLAIPLPLLTRVSLGYVLDNSAELGADVEEARYQALGSNRNDRLNETRHLLRRVERFALGINRVDAFGIDLGLEAPLRVAEEFYIHPILEWRVSVPVNRQGYDCLAVQTTAGVGDEDGCLAIAGVRAVPSTLTLAARILPPVRGLSLALGVDIGTTGTSTFVRELAPNKPYDVLLAIAYAVDVGRGPEREVEVVREVVREVPEKPRVLGLVVVEGTETPIPAAVVRYPGTEFTAQVVDDDGRFTSYGLEPGEARFEVSHAEYEMRVCVVTLPTGSPAPTAQPASASPALIPLTCALAAKPLGELRGDVVGAEDAAVAGAKIALTGPETLELVSGAKGVFAHAGLKPGAYEARVDAEGYLVKVEPFQVTAGLIASPRISLVAKAKVSQVELTQKEVRIRQQIRFRTRSAEILSDSDALLSEIADVLVRNPQVTGIEIQGHTDNTGDAGYNMRLSQSRAESVMQRLVSLGVEAGRLSAKGYGDTQPIVPNITARNRGQNRRVQFILR